MGKSVMTLETRNALQQTPPRNYNFRLFYHESSAPNPGGVHHPVDEYYTSGVVYENIV